MATARKVDNNLLGSYQVKTSPSSDGDIQHVIINDSLGNAVDSFGAALVTLTHTRPSVTTASGSILAANSSRKVGGWIQNNSDTDVWLEIGGAAVASQGISLLGGGGTFLVNTAQEIRAIHAGTGTKNLDVYEAT